jgi:hypothetical protein
LGQDVLELILDVGLEALSDRDFALSSLLLRVDAGLEVIEGLLRDLKLHSVVTRGDGLHIPLDIVEVTGALEVEEDSQVDTDGKDGEARHSGSLATLLLELGSILNALILNENLRVVCIAVSVARSSVHDVLFGEGVGAGASGVHGVENGVLDVRNNAAVERAGEAIVADV